MGVGLCGGVGVVEKEPCDTRRFVCLQWDYHQTLYDESELLFLRLTMVQLQVLSCT